MQLNVYIPKARERLIRDLEELSRRSGRAKSEILLDALDRYLAQQPPEVGQFHLGSTRTSRSDLYEDRLSLP